VSAPKVLIADDSPLVLRMIEKMLTGAGYDVVTAHDGLEAIEQAFAHDVGVIILDVMMPRMNGYQACRLLKSEPATRGVPVVILTSKDQAGDRFWGLETGADYYLTKDAEPQRIVDLVRNVMNNNTPRPPRPPEAARPSVDILSRVNELLDRKLFEATILSEIGRVARSLVHFDETFTSVMALVARVVDFTVGAMAFVDGQDLDVLLMLQRPTAPAIVEEAKALLLEAVSREHSGTPFRKVQARLFAPADGGMGGPEETSLRGFASFPILTNGRLSGMLAVAGRAAARTSGESQEFLSQVANQAQIVVENSRLFDRVRSLSVRDSLTELFNHRHSIELLGLEFERVGRYAAGVSVAMTDIDHFKAINDEHGHVAGDVVLRDLARLLKESLRTVDAVGRYGGEEFVAVLPHTTHDEALHTAERIRRAVQEHPFRAGDAELRVTVSIGVASYPSTEVDSPGALIREADKALYRAKQGGRNRVA
jgi:two-component system cell cycle response regulator